MSDKFNPSNALKDKRVLIVGGTSGIGLAAAIEAKAAGARVTVLGSDHERSRIVAAEHGFDGWRAADVTSLKQSKRRYPILTTSTTLSFLPGHSSPARYWKPT